MHQMDPKVLWPLFITIGIGTLLIRLSFIHLLGNMNVSATLARILRFVPPAVLSALILPAILVQNGSLDISMSNARIVSAMVAALVAIISKNTLMTIGSGMAVLWIYQMMLT
ncbi:MAG: AzlD domain-containing protein [Desulfobacterales bacterium]|nr:AzlD domain-containing protein [Desulfobacterales bacterium]